MIMKVSLLCVLLLSTLGRVAAQGDITPEQCFGGFGALGFRFDAFDRYDVFFRNESAMVNPHAGTYTGPKGIEEYVRFLSPTNTYVSIADGEHQPGLRGVVNGTCEILLLTNSWYTFSPDDARASSYNVTLMSLINYDPIDNYIKSLVLHLPDPWIKSLFEVTLGTDRTHRFVCKTMKESCPKTWELNQEAFSDVTVSTARNADEDADLVPCIEKLRSLPAVTNEHYIDGNSHGCRAFHAFYSSLNDFHCPHLSIIPQEDEKGVIKCQESEGLLPTDFFTADDLQKFDTFMKENDDRVNYPDGFKLFDLEEMDQSEIEGSAGKAEIETGGGESSAFGNDGMAVRLGALFVLGLMLIQY